MASIEFYNVKKKKKVQINDDKVSKKTYGEGTRLRYALRATDDDGVNLTKFISKDTFDSLNAPMAT